MAIAITDDHRELGRVVRAFLTEHGALAAHRAMLDDELDGLPEFWKELAALGWLGLHVPEDLGGSGYGLAELAVVLEETGRVVAPGPFLPSVWASAALVAFG